MPAPLDIDREAVKAHAITHGLRPAAKAFNLPVATLAAWSARDKNGPWCPRNPPAMVIQRPATLKPTANAANTPSQAALYSKAETLARTHRNMAVTADKGFKRAATMKGERIIAEAGQLHQLAKLAQVAHPELREDSAKGPVVSFTFHAGAPPPEAIEAPVTDI